MGEFFNEEEFKEFMRAANYIQVFTKRLLERTSHNPPLKIPDSLAGISQLTSLVKQYLKEQQEFAETVGKIYDVQRKLVEATREKSMKCMCKTNGLTHDLPLADIKRDDGTNFSLKLPTTSSSAITSQLNEISDPEPQNFEIDLLKMFGTVPSPNNFYNQIPHSSNSHQNHENGGGVFPDAQFFDSSSTSPPNSDKTRKSIMGKSTKIKRAHEMSMIGPYPCRHCDKMFRQKHGLAQHLLTHESNGAFECDGCGKRYSRQESVYRHQRSTQCNKYLTLTNVRHDEEPGPSDGQKPNPQLLSLHNTLFL